jgi:hypothetical protein
MMARNDLQSPQRKDTKTMTMSIGGEEYDELVNP